MAGRSSITSRTNLLQGNYSEIIHKHTTLYMFYFTVYTSTVCIPYYLINRPKSLVISQYIIISMMQKGQNYAH